MTNLLITTVGISLTAVVAVMVENMSLDNLITRTVCANYSKAQRDPLNSAVQFISPVKHRSLMRGFQETSYRISWWDRPPDGFYGLAETINLQTGKTYRSEGLLNPDGAPAFSAKGEKFIDVTCPLVRNIDISAHKGILKRRASGLTGAAHG